MKNAFYFILKALFILKIFKFWTYRKKDLIRNFEIYDVTAWLTKNYNTHCLMSHELKATRQ